MQLIEINWPADGLKYLAQVAELETVFAQDAFDIDQLDSALSGSNHVIAMVQDDRILCYTATDQSDKTFPGYYIWQLVTDPDYRGLGLASSVLYALIDKGLDLHLHVRSDNTVALGLYIDLGFTIHATLPDYYHDGMAALVLTRSSTIG